MQHFYKYEIGGIVIRPSSSTAEILFSIDTIHVYKNAFFFKLLKIEETRYRFKFF